MLAKPIKHYKEHFIGINTIGALIVAAGIIATIWTQFSIPIINEPTSDTQLAMYRTIATIAGSLTGFNITVTAPILNNWGHKSMSRIAKNHARSKEVRTVLKRSTWYMAMTTLTAILAILTNGDGPVAQVTASATIIVAALSAVRTCETIWIVHHIASIVMSSHISGKQG